MPDIRVIYWNVENFGDNTSGRRGNYIPLCNFIATVVRNADADILCLMELRNTATVFMGPLATLRTALNNAYAVGGNATCDWYCDWVPGSLLWNRYAPYDPNNVGFTTQGRKEGYAVLWKQNLAKFTMQRADPLDLQIAKPPLVAPVAAVVANTQSGGVQARGLFAGGPIGADLVAAPAQQYGLPAGSNSGPNGILSHLGGFLVPANTVTGALALNPGDVLTAGVQVANNGLVLINNQVHGVDPIVIPGGHVLTGNYTLPAAGTVLVPVHVLSLVMNARALYFGHATPYNPAGPNAWNLGEFPATARASFWNGSRRPAFCTIRATTAPAGVQQLIPITIYHTPLKGAQDAMIRGALSRSLFEAHSAGAYAHNTRALVGGDLNTRLDPAAFHYTIYTDTYANNAADFRDPVAGANIRVRSPAPMAPPAFPPYVPPATVAMNPFNRSGVMLRYPPAGRNNPILSGNFDHYRGSAIDNVFYRGFTAAQAPHCEFRATVGMGAQQLFPADLYDLIRAVSLALPPNAGAAPGMPVVPDNFFIPQAVVQQFLNLPAFVALAGGFAAPAFNPSLARNALLQDVTFGAFPNPMVVNPAPPPPGHNQNYLPPPALAAVPAERRAAEFIKVFVSDHLPVIFGMHI